MDRFEYVMVLISIIVGLSIANILFGVGGIIHRRAGGPALKLSIAHGFWLGYVFVWTVQFWWWEFRFSEVVSEWTVGLYFFLVGYAVCLFLLSVILVPRDWDDVDDLDDYLIKRRFWFYIAFGLAHFFDVADSLVKGGPAYIIDELGPSVWILWTLAATACVVGLSSKRIRHHEIMAGAVFIWQIVQAFNDNPTLGF